MVLLEFMNGRPLMRLSVSKDRINEIERQGSIKVALHSLTRSYNLTHFSLKSTNSHTTLRLESISAEQDQQHLDRAACANSIGNAEDACKRYLYSNILGTITSKYVADEYDHGPFKLICDESAK